MAWQSVKVIACVPDASAPAEALPGCMTGEIYQPVTVFTATTDPTVPDASHFEIAGVFFALVVTVYLLSTGVGMLIDLMRRS